jgi:Zn-dependent peptidase ImmA (M78 family)
MPADDLPGRVRALLAERGVKQGALAEAIGLDIDKMSKSLSGGRRFTSLEVALIAEHLDVTVNTLLGITEPEPAVAARSTGTHARTDPVLERLAEYAHIRTSLSALGYAAKIPTILFDHEPMWIDQGARLAEGVLERIEKLRADAGGRRDLATEIEDAFGIDVVQTDLEDGNDGFSHREGDVAVIAVATTDIPARQRFTLAHELAHVLAGDHQGLHTHGSGSGRKDPSEVRANAFAAALLMPESQLKLDPRAANLTDKNFASLVMDLEVSPNALAWRLWNLGMLTEDVRKRYLWFSAAQCASLADRADRLAEWCETGISPRPPMRLLKDALDAHLSGVATVRLFARAIGMPEGVVIAALDKRPSEDPAGM